MGQPMKKPPDDLHSAPWPELSWTPEARAASLDRLAAHVCAEADAVIRWYLDNKRQKRIWARLLRGLALLLILLAAVIPLLAELWTESDGFWLSPAWASMALVLAAGCIGFDRFFGFSTAWMRFITTEMRIRQTRRGFQLDWEARRLRWQDQPPDLAVTLEALAACKACLARLDALVIEETERWVQEFSAAIEEIDKSAHAAQAHDQRGGAVNITVTNGDITTDGWELVLDGGAVERHQGRTAAKSNIVSGAHRMLARGEIDGIPRHAERAFTVAPGDVIELELTLE
jgi:hypothetical protein